MLSDGSTHGSRDSESDIGVSNAELLILIKQQDPQHIFKPTDGRSGILEFIMYSGVLLKTGYSTSTCMVMIGLMIT